VRAHPNGRHKEGKKQEKKVEYRTGENNSNSNFHFFITGCFVSHQYLMVLVFYVIETKNVAKFRENPSHIPTENAPYAKYSQREQTAKWKKDFYYLGVVVLSQTVKTIFTLFSHTLFSSSTSFSIVFPLL
jgi:hypothetical protein